MISEGSCDTEDWSNENSDLPSGINYIKALLHLKIKIVINHLPPCRSKPVKAL